MDSSSSTISSDVTIAWTSVDLENFVREENSGLFAPSEAIVSNEVRRMMEYVVDLSLTTALCVLGLVGNSVTIVVFYRQGYKETINISLTAIAIWDLIKCVCGLIFRMSTPIQSISIVLGLKYYAYTGLSFAYTSTFCTYVSSVLGGYVAIERCLCVSLPFTVKYLLTPQVVTSVMILLSVVSFGSCSVIYAINEIVWVFHPQYNATVAQVRYSEAHFKYPILGKFYYAMGFLWPALSLGVQSFCTWIITYHLRKSSKFRSSSVEKQAKETKKQEMSARDRQVIKMLLVIIIVYMVNLLPRLTVTITKTVVPGFLPYMRYHNLFYCCMWFQFFFDFCNASVNPFIYFFMSSQFKTCILKMFCFSKK